MNIFCDHLKATKRMGVVKMVSLALVSLSFLAFQTHAADLPEIKARGYMKVVTEDYYAPFNFIKSGKPQGFNQDVIEELKKYADFEIKQEILPWTGLLASTMQGVYDVAITGVGVSDERLKSFNYVAPYVSAQYYYVTRADDKTINSLADLSGKTLGTQSGTIFTARIEEFKAMIEKSGGHIGKIVEYQSFPEAYADLSNGRLDYVVDLEIPIFELMSKKPGAYKSGQAIFSPQYFAWPIAKSSPELLAYLTKFVTHLKETGKLAELQKRWFGKVYDNLPSESIISAEQLHKLAISQ